MDARLALCVDVGERREKPINCVYVLVHAVGENQVGAHQYGSPCGVEWVVWKSVRLDPCCWPRITTLLLSLAKWRDTCKIESVVSMWVWQIRVQVCDLLHWHVAVSTRDVVACDHAM